MIRLESKAVVVNDSRSNMYLNMDANVDVQPRDSIGYIINQILRYTPIHNLVINCHGSPASLQVGVGLKVHQTHLFRRLRGRVRKIWLYSCSAASGEAGREFCASIATAARCYVLASPAIQHESPAEMRGLPLNSLDTFEGRLMSFDRNGQVNWSRTYPAGAPNPS